MSDGEDTPEGLKAAEAFDHLSFECLVHGRRNEAVEYRRRALAVREQLLGPDHPDVANSLIVLAGVIGRAPSDGPEVEALSQRAADIYEAIVRRADAERGEAFTHAFMGLLGALNNLALFAGNRGDLDAAEAGYRDILARIAEHSGPDCRYVHPSLPGFARLLIERGKIAEAESLLRDALARADEGAGSQWVVAACEEALAELCAGQHRGAEAEGLYRLVVARRERIAQNGRPGAAGAAAHSLRGLARLCRGTGRVDEADGLERQAAEWSRRRAEAMPWEEERPTPVR